MKTKKNQPLVVLKNTEMKNIRGERKYMGADGCIYNNGVMLYC